MELFKDAGLGPEWLNYRLNGTQSDFTDSTGKDTILANSVIEDSPDTSSCMTCHAQERIDKDGIITQFDDSRTGVPDWSWFYADPNRTKTLAGQLDFVWSFRDAQPQKAPPGPAPLKPSFTVEKILIR